MAALARKLYVIGAKTLLFFILFCLFAKFIDASKFISYETTSHFSDWLYGASSQDNFDNLWFFADVGLTLFAAIFSYKIILLAISKKVRF